MKRNYYVCEPKELAALSFVTFGIYNIYFYYKNFELNDGEDHFNLMNVIKSVLYPYFSYSLLEHNINNTSLLSSKVVFSIQLLVVVGAILFPSLFDLMAFFAFLPLILVNNLLKLKFECTGDEVSTFQLSGRYWYFTLVGLVLVGTIFIYRVHSLIFN